MYSNRKWYGAGSAGGGGRRGFSTAGSSSGYTLSMNHYHYYDRHSGGANKFSSNLVLLLLVGFLFFTAQFIIVSKINPDSLMNPKHHKSKYSALENLDTGGRDFLINKHMKEHENHVLEARQRRDRGQQKETAKMATSQEEVKADEVVKNPDIGDGDEKTRADQVNSDTALNSSDAIKSEHVVHENSPNNGVEKDIIKSQDSQSLDAGKDAGLDGSLESNELENKNPDIEKEAATIEQNLPEADNKNSELIPEPDSLNDQNSLETNENEKMAIQNEPKAANEISNSAKEFETEPEVTEQTNENAGNPNLAADQISGNVEKYQELGENVQDLLGVQNVDNDKLSEGNDKLSEGKVWSEKETILDESANHPDKGRRPEKHSPEEI